PGAPNDWPSLGAIVRRIRGDHPLPAAVTLPEQTANDGNLTWPGQDGGFLGRSCDPWLLDCDPNAAQFQLPGLALPSDVPSVRFDQRRTLLEQVDRHLDQLDRHSAQSDHLGRSRKAFDLINSPAAKRAFRLEEEGPRVRDRYGRTKF